MPAKLSSKMAENRPRADENETDAGDQLERQHREMLLGGAAESHGECAGGDQRRRRRREDQQRALLALGREQQSGELSLVTQFREEHGEENRQELLHWKPPQEPDDNPWPNDAAGSWRASGP